MKSWIAQKQLHLVFWGLLVTYLLTANTIYVHYFMKNGKPTGVLSALPAQTNNLVHELNYLQPVIINGQNLYELRGFAFLKDNPTQANKITVILNKPGKTFAFATTPVQFPNMIESYPGYTPAMNGAEFTTYISNDGLEPGIYQVGIRLDPAGGGAPAFKLTSYTITKTPNTINYKADNP